MAKNVENEKRNGRKRYIYERYIYETERETLGNKRMRERVMKISEIEKGGKGKR